MTPTGDPSHHRDPSSPSGLNRLSVLCGFCGTGGNERLTAMTGAVLVVLLAVEGLTILRSYAGGMQHVTTGAPWRTRS